MKDRQMLTKTGLKSRGWTERLIRQFVPIPHMVKHNPKNGKSNILLYFQGVILGIEGTPEFSQVYRGVIKNRKRGQKALLTRKANELRKIQHFDYSAFEFPKLSRNELYARAVLHYNQLDFGNNATTDESPEFLNRISKNYLRHVVIADYDFELSKLKGKLMKDECYLTIRSSIDSAIQAAYAFLY